MRKDRKGDLLRYLIGPGAEANVKGMEWLSTMMSRKRCEIRQEESDRVRSQSERARVKA